VSRPVALLTIGEVARKSGVPVTTVRYYDRIGLVGASSRIGGKRRYLPRAVDRIVFVRRCLGVGFTLAQVADILDDDEQGEGGWRPAVEAKIGELVAQRDRIDAMISTLSEALACDCLDVTSCRPELRA